MGKRKQKPPGKCIFCDRSGVTKEHVFSDWLGALIPANQSHMQGVAAFDFDRNTKEFRVLTPMSSEEKRGCLSQRKIRKVCDVCNNGWMSRAVETAKPVAEKLAIGLACRFDESKLAKLIPWLSITIVMQEYISSPNVIFIPPEDRKFLMETNLPPLDWTIWIGYYVGNKWQPLGHAHYVAQLSNKESEHAAVTPKIPPHRIQIATFTLRKFLVHTFTGTALGLANEYRKFVGKQSWNLFQVWPTIESHLTWPRFPILDGELREIVTKFGHDRLGHERMGFDFGQ